MTLLEARGRLGGAAYSFNRGELTVDNGQHVFLRCCTAYRELLEQLGATELVTLQPRLDVAVLAPGGRARLSASVGPAGATAPRRLAAALPATSGCASASRWPGRCSGCVRSIVDDPANDAASFGDWLRRHRQSRRAIETIWELIVRPTLNLTVEDASLAQAAQVFQVGLLGDASAGDIGWGRARIGEIHDRAARAALERAGVEVRVGSTAQALIAPEIVAGVGGRPVELQVDASDGFSGPWPMQSWWRVPPAQAARLLPPQVGARRLTSRAAWDARRS